MDDDLPDPREYAIGVLEALIEGVMNGQITGLIIGADSDGSMQFFTTHDHRDTITAAALTNHWAINRVITANTQGMTRQ